MTGTCYLCRTKAIAIERDHLPPKCLFEDPLPSNLITRPICSQCHKPTHKDDEALQVFVAAYITRNQAAARLWKDKIVPRTLNRGRIRPFIDHLRTNLRPVLLRTSTAEIPVMVTHADGVPINRVLTRLTRGLYSFVAPHIDSRDFPFKIRMIDPFALNDRMQFAAQMLQHFSRGNQVYDCWWGLDGQDARHGLWVHMFFQSVAFAVRH